MGCASSTPSHSIIKPTKATPTLPDDQQVKSEAKIRNKVINDSSKKINILYSSKKVLKSERKPYRMSSTKAKVESTSMLRNDSILSN